MKKQLLLVLVLSVILIFPAASMGQRMGGITGGLGSRYLISNGPEGPIHGGESGVTDMVLAPDGWVYGGTKATWGAKNCHLFRTDVKTSEHVLNITERLPGQTRVTDLTLGPDGLIYGCTSIDNKSFDEKKPYEGGHIFVYNTKTKDFIDLGVMVKGDGINCIAVDPDTSRTFVYGVSYPNAHLFKLGYPFDVEKNKVKVLMKDFGPVKKSWRVKDRGRVSWRGVPKVLMIDDAGTVYFSSYIGDSAGGRIFRLAKGDEKPVFTGAIIPCHKGQDTNPLYENGIASAVRARDGGFWCGTINDGFLFKFHPSTSTIINKGKGYQIFNLKGLTYGGDGKLYGIAGTYYDTQRLMCYDTTTGSIEDLGFPSATTQLGAVCATKDGTVLMAEELRNSYIYPYVGSSKTFGLK